MNVRCLPLLIALFLLPQRGWSQAGNDAFSRRIPLSGNKVTAVSNLRTATRETGEPSHANNAGTHSLWWTWTAPTTGTVNFSTFGGGATPGQIYSTAYTRALALYTGDSLSSLSEVASAGTINTPLTLPGPRISGAPAGPSFNAQVTAGTTYQIAVDGPAALNTQDDGTVALTINQAPTIYSPAGASGTAGSTFSYLIQASNNPTEFSATNLPTGLVLNPTTGEISGTPAKAGTYVIRLGTTNPGGTGTGTLTLTIPQFSNPPTVPAISGAAATTGIVGTAFNYFIFGYYIFASTGTTCTADNLPPGLILDSRNGTINGTPTAVGTYNVSLTATNALGTSRAVVAISILAVPDRPVITSNLSATGTVGSSFYFTVAVSDTSGPTKPTGYGASGLPPGLGFDPTTGTLKGTPGAAGVYSVPITASNAGGTSGAVLTVVIAAPSTASSNPPPAPPVLSSSAVSTGSVGNAFSYALRASNTPTAFTAGDLPPGLSFNAASGFITGTPTTVGSYQVPVSASNGLGTSNATLTINIQASPSTSNSDMVFVIDSPAEASGYVGGYVSYRATATPRGSYLPILYNPNEEITFSATNLPPGLSFDNSQYSYTRGYIVGTPTMAGTYTATLTATPASSYSNTKAGSAQVTFFIAASRPPVVVIPPVFYSSAAVKLNLGESYSDSSPFYADNSPTSYTASGLPPGLTFNSATGRVSGSPTTAGTYPVAVTATNSGGTGKATVTIIVAAATTSPLLPKITNSPVAAGLVGSSFSFNVNAPAASTVTVTNLPPGLSWSSGTISGLPTQAGVYAVPITAANSNGTAYATLTITIAATQPAPRITSYAAARGTVGAPFSYSIYADNSGGPFTVTNLPPGLSQSGSNVSGTPTQTGVWDVSIAAAGAGGTGTATVTFTIVAPSAPVFASKATANGVVGSAFSYSLAVTSSAALSDFVVANLPPGLTYTYPTISGTPTQAGVYRVPVTANGPGGTTNATLTITVASATASIPVFSSAAAASGTVGATFSYTLVASGSPTAYDLGTNVPPGLSFNPKTGVLAGKPTTAGTYVVPVSASNASGLGQAKVTLTFTQPASVPVVSSPLSAQGWVGSPFYYFITAEGATSYDASSLPPGVTLNAATGVISGTPTTAGNYLAAVTALNAAGSSYAYITINVAAPPVAHVTSPLAASATLGVSFSYAAATDLPATSYGASGLPAGLSINASTGRITGVPQTTGSFPVSLSVTTSKGTARATLILVVMGSNNTAPILSSNAGAFSYTGQAFFYYLAASNSPTSYVVNGLPSGVSFDATRGLISGTPTLSGVYSVSVTATNATDSVAATLTLQVLNLPANLQQFTSPAAASASIGVPFSYQLATNGGGDVYSYSISNLPSGLSLNSSTGKISGTPTVQGTASPTVTAYNSSGYTLRSSLTIRVVPATPVPPVISSAAAAVGAAGSPFSYAMTASGSPTSYAASNLPPGLSLNSASGLLTGTVAATGTYSIPVSATNDIGIGNATLTLVIAPLSPTLNAVPLEVTAVLGTSTVVYRIPAEGAPSSYNASGLPPGLSLDPASGAISGAPTAVGIYQATISASNASGSVSAVLTIAVVSSSAPPTFSYNYASTSGKVGQSLSVNLSATGGSPATYTASGLPPGLTLNTSTGEAFGAPTAAGVYTITFTAINAYGSDRASTKVYIDPTFPVLASNFSEAGVAGQVGVSTYASLSFSGAAVCTVSGLPPGMVYTVDSDSIDLQGTPTTHGTYPVTFTASNPAGTSQAIITFNLTDGPSPAPRISSQAGVRRYVDDTISYAIYDGDSALPPMAYSASGLPDGLQLNPLTGAITGMVATPGIYPVTITESKATGTSSAVVTFHILAGPPPPSDVPVITSAAAVYYSINSSYAVGTTQTWNNFSYTITAAYSPTSFAASNLPAGLVLNPATGQISGLPLVAGTFMVPISATNSAGTGSAVLKIITPASAPGLSAPLALGATVGSLFSYSAGYYLFSLGGYYYSINIDPTTYSARGLPPGLSMNPTTGTIAGTPLQTGTFPVVLAATSRAGTVTAVTTFAVSAASTGAGVTGSAPVVYGRAVAAGYVGQPLSATFSGGVSYTVGSLPAGLNFNSSTGTLSGTPTVPGVYAVPVAANNAYGIGTATLTIDVATAPPSPVISSVSGPSATVGSPFSYLIFTSSTSGTSSAVTNYGASNLPTGLSFDAARGVISGVPAVAGTYTVPISVTAGGVTGNATLTLNVQPAPTVPTPSAPVFSTLAGTLGFTGVPFSFSPDSAFTLDGAPPAGLSHSLANGLTGLPTTAGSFELPFSAAGTGGAVGRGTLSLRIIAPELSLPLVVDQPTGGIVNQGSSASFTAVVVGAPAPVYQWLHDGVAVPSATGPSLGSSAVQPADAGVYTLVATNSSGRAMSSPVFLTVIQTYDSWRSAHFTAGEIAAGLGAANYDFNGDGTPNLLEYALGRDPRTGLGGGLPTSARSAGGALQLQFSRDTGKTDLTYIVEASPDLRTWTAIAQSTAGSATLNLGGAGAVMETTASRGWQNVTVQEAPPTSASRRNFLRLRVVQR